MRCVLALSLTLSVSTAQTVHSDDELKYSMTLPDGWVSVTPDELDAINDVFLQSAATPGVWISDAFIPPGVSPDPEADDYPILMIVAREIDLSDVTWEQFTDAIRANALSAFNGDFSFDNTLKVLAAGRRIKYVALDRDPPRLIEMLTFVDATPKRFIVFEKPTSYALAMTSFGNANIVAAQFRAPADEIDEMLPMFTESATTLTRPDDAVFKAKRSIPILGVLSRVDWAAIAIYAVVGTIAGGIGAAVGRKAKSKKAGGTPAKAKRTRGNSNPYAHHVSGPSERDPNDQ